MVRLNLVCGPIIALFALGIPMMSAQESGNDDPAAKTIPASKPEAVQQAWDAKRRFFILVAVNKYTTPDADLPFAAVDAQKVSDFLKKAGYDDLGSFGDTAATRDNFIEGVLSSGLTLKDLGLGTTIFTSSSDIQESQKIDIGDTQMSAFTYSLLRALTDDWDQVDLTKSGFIGYKELHLFSINQLRAWNKQGKVAGLMRPLLLSNDDMLFTYDPSRDRQGPSLYRNRLLGDALYFALAPTAKLTEVTPLRTVALRYPIPSARARRIASFISAGHNSFVAALQAIAQGRPADADMYLAKASTSRVLSARIARAKAWNALYSGKYGEAATQYKTALALARGDARRALLLETANALQLAGSPRDASVLYAQVVQTGNTSPPDSLSAVALNNWGTANITLGHIEAAEQAFNRSLAISGQNGPLNLDVATSSSNMAYIAQHKGDDTTAASLQEKSANIRSAKELKGGDYSAWSDAAAAAASMDTFATEKTSKKSAAAEKASKKPPIN